MFLSVSTINSMDDVLGSVIVTERLKTRKSLATNYWEDIISGVEVKSNDRNVKNLWKVSTSFQVCAIFHLKTTFFSSWKIHVSKNLSPRFLRACRCTWKSTKKQWNFKEKVQIYNARYHKCFLVTALFSVQLVWKCLWFSYFKKINRRKAYPNSFFFSVSYFSVNGLNIDRACG